MCWFFHKWGKWSNPELGEARWFSGKTAERCMVQERKCENCNKRELRRAS